MPYKIGYISKDNAKLKLSNSIKMVKKELVFLYQGKEQI